VIKIGNYRVLLFIQGNSVLLIDIFNRRDLNNNYPSTKFDEIATDKEFKEYIKNNGIEEKIRKDRFK